MISVCKVPKEGSNSHYVLQTEWRDNSFSIIIYENGISWLGNASEAEIDNLSQELKINRNEYMKESKGVLTRDGGHDQFSYCIENEQFIWKKRVRSLDISIKFGYVKLESAPLNGVVGDMFDILLDKSKKLHQETQDLMIKNDTLESEKNNLNKKLDKLIEEKRIMEETLYGKFLAILNAKKDKIRILENQVQEATTVGVPQRAHVIASDSETPDDLEDVLSSTQIPARSKAKLAGRGRGKAKGSAGRSVSNPVPKRQCGNVKDNEANPAAVEPPSSSDSNHYSSDTDIDDMVPTVGGKEITSNSSPVTKRTMLDQKAKGNLFEEDFSWKSSLPKRTKQNASNSYDSVGTCRTLITNTRSENDTTLSQKVDNVNIVPFNTQALLDEI